MLPPKKTSGVAQSYDDQFLTNAADSEQFKQWSAKPGKLRLATHSAFDQELHRADVDTSNRDYIREGTNPILDQFADMKAADPFREIRAANQGFTPTVAAGLGRTISKAATEIAKTPGIIGGLAVGTAEAIADVATGEDKHDFIETAFNNPWIKAADDLNQYANTNLMPVYVSKAVEDGDLFKKLTSSEFWATDGADGVGFAIGAMFPGEALSSLGLGSKLVNSISKLSKAPELFQGAARAEQLVSGLTKLGITPKNINTAIAVGYNTVSEAGAEAKGIGDNFENNKPEILANYAKSYKGTGQYQQDRARLIKELSDKVETGQMSEDEYAQLSSDTNLDNELMDRKFKDQKSKAQANVFNTNLAILLGPNLMMHNRLFGKLKDGTEAIVDTAKQTAKRQLLDKAGKMTISATKTLASEGFWEEGLQTTVENLFTGKGKRGELTSSFFDTDLGDVAKEYLNTVTSTEGQAAIALGGIIGSGMTSIEHLANSNKRRAAENSILTNVSQSANTLNTIFNASDVYEKDADGKTVFEEDANGVQKPKVDLKKASEYARALVKNEVDSKRFEAAIANNDTKTVEEIKRQALQQWVLPAVMSGERGLATLKDQLKQYGEFDDIKNREGQLDAKTDFNNFTKETMELADHLLNEKNKFEDFNEGIVDLSYTHPDFPGLDYKKLRGEFMNELGHRYLDVKSQLYFNNKELKKLENKRDRIVKELGFDEAVLEDERTVIAERTNPLLKKVSDDIRDLNSKIEKNKKDVAEVWGGITTDGKTPIRKAYEDFVDDNIKASEEFSPDKLEKVNDVIGKVKDISDIKSLNQFEKSLDRNFKRNPLISANINVKRAEIQALLDEDTTAEQDTVRTDADNRTFDNADENIDNPNPEDNPNVTDNPEDEDNNSTDTDEGLDEDLDDGSPVPDEDLDEEDEDYEPEDESDLTHEFLGDDATIDEKLTSSTKPVDISKLGTFNKLHQVFKDFLAFVRTPLDKTGTESPLVTFEVTSPELYTQGVKSQAKLKELTDLLHKDNLTEKELETLYNDLPLVISSEHNGKTIKAPFHVYTEANEKHFKSDYKPLRIKLINAYLANGKSFEGVTSRFSFQYGGILETTGKDTSIANLQFVSGKTTDELVKFLKTKKNIVYINKLGNAWNAFTKKPDTKLFKKKLKGKGEVFMIIPNNAGKDFPLKLNTSRISENKAEAIYQIMKALSQYTEDNLGSGRNIGKMGFNQFLKEYLDPSLKKLFKSEIQLLKDLGIENANVDTVLSVLMHTGSKNIRTLINRADANTSTWTLGANYKGDVKTFTNDQFKNDNTAEGAIDKQNLIDYIVQKRHNLILKDDTFNLNNEHYLKYLIDNQILSTDVKPFNEKKPAQTATFQGLSSIYIDDNITTPKSKVEKKVVKKPAPAKPATTEEINEPPAGSLIAAALARGKMIKTTSELEGEVKPTKKVTTPKPANISDAIDTFVDNYNKMSSLDKTKQHLELTKTMKALYIEPNEIKTFLKENLPFTKPVDKSQFKEALTEDIRSAIEENSKNC